MGGNWTFWQVGCYWPVQVDAQGAQVQTVVIFIFCAMTLNLPFPSRESPTILFFYRSNLVLFGGSYDDVPMMMMIMIMLMMMLMMMMMMMMMLMMMLVMLVMMMLNVRKRQWSKSSNPRARLPQPLVNTLWSASAKHQTAWRRSRRRRTRNRTRRTRTRTC